MADRTLPPLHPAFRSPLAQAMHGMGPLNAMALLVFDVAFSNPPRPLPRWVFASAIAQSGPALAVDGKVVFLPNVVCDNQSRLSCLTAELLAEPPGLRGSCPIAVEMSVARYQISFVGVGRAAVRACVLRELSLGDNSLSTLDGSSRFRVLRVVSSNQPVDVRLPRLGLLDLSSDRLGALPALQGCSAQLALCSFLPLFDSLIR